MSLVACPEPFPPFLEEVKPLMPRHWEELALDKDEVPLDPDYDEYLRLDGLGRVLTVAVREHGKLVGYFVGFIGPALHYRSLTQLTLDIFWIAPEHRGKSGGILLFKAVEAEARRRGVGRMFVGSKCHKDASWLFERLGYTEVERYYSATFFEASRAEGQG
jgi:GNAT superfamily N-acetyltransferase